MTASNDAEAEIIGACLLRPETLDIIIDMLRPAMFNDVAYGEIFGVMMDMTWSNKKVTSSGVSFALGEKVADKATGAVISSLKALADKAGDIPVRQHASALVERYQRINGAKILDEAMKALSKNGANPDDILFAMTGKIDALMDIGGSSQIFGEYNAGAEYFSQMEMVHKEGYKPGIPFPLAEIGHVIEDETLQKGRLMAILSSSGEGKTSLTIQILDSAIAAQHPTLFLSYDQSRMECIQQMVAQKYGISVKRQAKADLSADEFEKCFEFSKWLDKQPFRIVECGTQNVTQLIRICEQFQKKYGSNKTTLIAIDHIGKIKSDSKKEVDAGKGAGAINQIIKAYVRTNNAAAIVLNQRNTYGMRRQNPVPIDDDLYGGEGARADYDVIMYIYRKEKYANARRKIAVSVRDEEDILKIFGKEDVYRGTAEFGALKVRFGDPNVIATVRFNGPYTRYESMRHESPQENFL